MGQYLGQRKIGTCEMMYYMRLEEAQELAEQGAKDNDGISFTEYLADGQTKFRFPFPDEDQGIPTDCKYDKSFMLPAGDIEVEHDTICVSNSIDRTHNVNIFLPCPYSQEFKALGLKTSTGGPGEQMLNVRMQAIRDGRETTIFECARCGNLQRFDDEDTAKIKERAIEYYSVYDTTSKNPTYTGGNQGLYNYAMKVIERIK